MRKEKDLKKIFKLGGITNVPSYLVKNLKIAPCVTLKVNKLSKPVDLHFKVELVLGKNVFDKTEFFQSVSSDGNYLLPLPLEVKEIPPDAKSVSLRVVLQVGRTVLAEKKTSVPILLEKNLLKLSSPYIKGRQVIAGERQDYFCDLKNNSKNPIPLYIEIILIPLGGVENKIFSEPRNIPPGRQETIQARSIIPIDSLGECFVMARVKFKQEEQELEQCTAQKVKVKLSSEPILKIKIDDMPPIPSKVVGGERMSFNVKILQNVESTKLKFDVVVVDENSENKLKTFEIRQQKGEQRMYGPINWDTPKVSDKKEFYIDFKVYKDKELLSEDMISKEKMKVAVTPS
ncbi:MAG: hypothetical protein QW279_07430 [Candidatus Jordarchaeaceae archaeon]